MADSRDRATVRTVPDGTLAFGIQLPVQALSSVIAADWEHDAGVVDLVAAARAADRAGFLYVAVCDHVAIPTAMAGAMSTTWFNPVATLGYLAGLTERTRLMTNIYVAGFRAPLDTAKAFSTLDVLSNGRVILGVGAGHVAGEFAAMGVAFEDRGRLLDRALEGIHAAWADEWVDDVGLRPRPAQQPRPPIWIGGSSNPALRRVAEYGDGWLPQGTPRQEMPARLDYLRRHRDGVRPEARLDLGTVTEWLHIGEAWDFPGPTVSGSPEEVAASMNEFSAMGVNHLQVRLRARSAAELVEQIERFGGEVGPGLEGPPV